MGKSLRCDGLGGDLVIIGGCAGVLFVWDGVQKDSLDSG